MCWKKRRYPVDPRPGYSSNRSGSSTRRGSGFATRLFTRTRTRPHPACNTASRVAHLADDPGRREALTVPSRPGLLLRILIGPFAFLAVQIVPLTGLAPEAHLAFGSYAWVLAWWAATPIPWAVTGFLPLVLFPLCDVMTFREVSALYGQRVHPRFYGRCRKPLGLSGLRSGVAPVPHLVPLPRELWRWRGRSSRSAAPAFGLPRHSSERGLHLLVQREQVLDAFTL